jgi:hypothetical protein
MDDVAVRFLSDLVGRITGPFSFRLLLQPAMASLFAIRDGLRDARSGRPAYFWTMLNGPDEARRLIAEGWHAVIRIILLGVVIEIAYQVIVFHRIYPFELIVVVLVLAILPYLILRGPVNRVARWWIQSRRPATSP